MLHVTDDTDDLFRQAAEGYPLKTGKPDWNGLRKKMEALAISETKKQNNKNRNFFLLVLFLLIPYKILFNELVQHAGKGIALNVSANPVLINNGFNPHDINNTGIFENKKNQKLKDPGAHLPVNDINNPVKKYNKKYVSYASNIHINTSIPIEEEDYKLAPFTKGLLSDTSKFEIPVSEIEKKENENRKVIVKTQAEQSNKKLKEKRSPGHFYAGIIIGPDVTSIKRQAVKKPGFSYGIITGYRFNKRWSAETGLLADKKYYDTEGKYFSTKEIPLPYNVVIDHANGYCNMLEIPVNVRYDFKRKTRSGLFLSAGVSSYLMKKEYYKYDLKRYGTNYSRDYTYNKSSNTIMSVLNVSAGYTHKIGKAANLRIEPYIKFPLKKVGIGSLPLQSAGMYFSVTKNIF